MAFLDGKTNQSPDDWGVVIQSVPSKSKKAILKQLVDIFNLDKSGAEQVLSNMPLVLLDGIPFGLAVRIKKFFQELGAVSETTNHDMIKKNCFQVVWPQLPDLSRFIKDQEAAPVAGSVIRSNVEQIKESESAENLSFADNPATTSQNAKQPESVRLDDVPLKESRPASENTDELMNLDNVSAPVEDTDGLRPVADSDAQPVGDLPATSRVEPVADAASERAVPEAPIVAPARDESAPIAHQSANPSWERRAKELNEKLQKIQDEKQQLVEKHTEAAEKVEAELRQEIEKEKQKREELSKSFEDLQKKADKHDDVAREGEAWRERADSMTERIKGIEAELARKNETLESLTREKNYAAESLMRSNESLTEIEAKLGSANRELAEALSREKDLSRKISEAQSAFESKASDLSSLQERITELESSGKAAKTEISTLKEREQIYLEKTEDLEQEIRRKNDDLASRDEMLSQFERQVLELAAKVAEFEPMRREHAQFLQERNTIRKEYEGRINEQDARLAKLEDEHRRYRSRADRKNAAATRELGDAVRSVDSLRQVLQKLILFLGSEAAVLDTEKKVILKSPLTRGPSSVSP